MSDATRDAAPAGPALAQTYLFVGLGAVVGLGVALLQGDAEPWAVLPALVGGAGLVFRWRLATLCVYLALTFALLAPRFQWGHFRDSRPAPMGVEMLLCASALVYALAHYRLLALEAGLFPADPRRPPPPPRAVDPAAAGELPAALTAAAAATLAAFLLWTATASVPVPLSINPRHWRVGLVIWAIALALVTVTGTLGYLGWRRRSAAAAEVYLRDVFWAETRREQRVVGRWLAYGLRRRERRARR